ncbi:MAG TPA: aminoglycoside phosphotransferase family protein [Candidatus Binatia bacterium]|nr:aminoglycoside phosphotransferase family protein [Candidatus Binatia bacterium]
MGSGLDERVAAALAHYGVRPVSWTRITLPRPAVDPRAVYRLVLDDGRTVKARRCRTEREARQLWEIRRHLALDGFARVHAQHGAVLVEEWIEGAPLPDREAASPPVVEAARLLAQLHRVASLGAMGAGGAALTATWRAEAERNLALVAEAERALARGRGWQPLSPERTRALADAVHRLDPLPAATGLIHRDFCAENMVRGCDGRLWVIDNEWLMVGPLGYDLARVWYRWPMPGAAWALFLDTYAACRGQPVADAPLMFWKIAAVARSAVFRVAADPGGLEVPLARLHELSDALPATG